MHKSNEPPVDMIIKNLMNELKDQIEIYSLSNENDKLNIQFMKMLDETSSSGDSSSSTLTSSSEDDEETKNKKSKKLTPKPKIVSESDEDSADDYVENFKQKNSAPKYVKTKDELTIEDLAPAEYVEVNLEDNVKLTKLGKVISKVDNKLIVVQSFVNETEENLLPLDEDTILFDSNRKSLGKIFETFGPVSNPFYTIRFNNLNEIKDRNLDLDLNSLVFFAQSQKYTKFVFNIEELRKQKGSDASWNNDNEPPAEFLDYSDDEQEKFAKRQLKEAKNKLVDEYSNTDGEDDDIDIDENQKKTSPNKNTQNFNHNYKKKISTNSFKNQNQNESTSGHKRKFSTNNNNNNNNNKNQNQQFNKSKSFQNSNNQSFQQNKQFFPVQVPNYYAQQQQMYWNQMAPHFNNNLMSNGMFNQGYNIYSNQTMYNPSFPQNNYQYAPMFPNQSFPYQFQQFPNQGQQQLNQQGFQTNNNNKSPTNSQNTNISQVVDKRFIQNTNLVKKSF